MEDLRHLEGKRVRAKTYPSYERSPDPTDSSLDEIREVEGILVLENVALFTYFQCLVNGTPVNPDTIEPLTEHEP